MAKRKTVEAARAVAWTINDPIRAAMVLCCWAEPDKERLVRQSPPSPEAKPVHVRIIRESDYRELLRAARTKGE